MISCYGGLYLRKCAWCIRSLGFAIHIWIQSSSYLLQTSGLFFLIEWLFSENNFRQRFRRVLKIDINLYNHNFDMACSSLSRVLIDRGENRTHVNT